MIEQNRTISITTIVDRESRVKVNTNYSRV
jgi:hypothetical protein